MSELPPAIASFAYVAQDIAGRPITGTIEAATIASAADQLNALNLRVTHLAPATPAVRRALSAQDVATFNQQLTYLTQHNLPLEPGLRLIVDEMSGARMSATLKALTADLEAGLPLDAALDRQGATFPPLYASLVRAGIASNSLPGALLNYNRHIVLVSELRAALWRALAYPLLLLTMLATILTFIGRYIVPHFAVMQSFRWGRPPSSVAVVVFAVSRNMPTILLTLAIFLSAVFALGLLIRWSQPRGAGGDALLHLPMLGGVLRQNLLARWCDALKLTTSGGIPLPEALTLTGEMVGSPALRRDSGLLAEAIRAGHGLDEAKPAVRLLPRTILTTAQLAAEHGDLPRALGVLATMYQQAAELRLNALQTTLVPLLLAMVAVLMFFVILGLFEPMFSIV